MEFFVINGIFVFNLDFLHITCHNGEENKREAIIMAFVKSAGGKKDYPDLSVISFHREGAVKLSESTKKYGTFGVHFVTRGKALLKIGASEHPLFRGVVFFTLPSLPFLIDEGQDTEIISVFFDGEDSLQLIAPPSVTRNTLYFEKCRRLTGFVEDALKHADEENGNLLAKGILLSSIGYVRGAASKEKDKSSAKKRPFGSILRYIDDNYSNPDLSLNRVASEFSYTEKHLSFMFRKNLGSGFCSYLTDLRIGKACDLLKNANLSVAEVALRAGYKDALYFSKVFKRNTGKTPTEYMKG